MKSSSTVKFLRCGLLLSVMFCSAHSAAAVGDKGRSTRAPSHLEEMPSRVEQRRIKGERRHTSRAAPAEPESLYARRRRLQEEDEDEDDEDEDDDEAEKRKKKCKSNKSKKTCSPTVSPSSSPSIAPSISDAPSASPAPSFGPSSNPSSMPSPEPTPSPSAAPSLSFAPSLSMAPSLAPSPEPSSVPSPGPSLSTMPSSSPSKPPTPAPTSSQMPSPGPSISLVPSGLPTVEPTPTPSVQPSAGPSATPQPSPSPSLSPSHQPTNTPSLQPSGVPSSKPSEMPTLSLRPSAFPSAYPTSAPSVSPTPIPTASPSSRPTPTPTNTPSTSAPSTPPPTALPTPNPTTSPMPSDDPNGFSSRTEIIGDNQVELIYECRRDIPETAFDLVNQRLDYNYILNLEPGSLAAIVLYQVEVKLQDAMADIYLNCTFESGPDFFTHAFRTSPVDTADAGCFEDEAVPGADCYQIVGGFTATIFYLPDDTTTTVNADNNNNTTTAQQQRRHSAASLAQWSQRRQRRMAETIADPRILESFNKSLTEIFASGLVEEASPAIVETNFAGITNPLAPPPVSAKDDSNVALIAGVAAGCAGLIILGAGLHYAGRRRVQSKRTQYYEEAMDYVDDEIDAERTVGPQARGASLATEEESIFSGLGGGLDQEVSSLATGRRDNVQFVATTNSDDELSSSPHRQQNFTVPDEEQQAFMLKTTRKELGPRKYQQRAGYDEPDTVDL